MKRWVWGVPLALLLLLSGLSAYAMLQVQGELAGIRRTLTSGAAGLDRDDLTNAHSDLEQLVDHLEGPVYSVLDLFPVTRQNIEAARAISGDALPVIATALQSAEFIEAEDDRLFRDGTVRLEALDELAELMVDQARTVEQMTATARAHRSGWLIPSAWEDVTAVVDAGEQLSETVGHLAQSARLAPELLGGNGPRTFAVVLLNNAELRGAGGIATAIGSVTFDRGRMDVGPFSYYRDLAGDPPFRKVEAPADFSERFGRYRADTTQWINVSTSPDIPDVGAVVDELMAVTANKRVSGVIVLDPRGLASFLEEDDDIDSDRLDQELTAGRVPRFVYSDAYEIFSDPSERRDALLSLAPSVLQEVTEELDLRTLRRVGAAAAGGHLALYSERNEEQLLLTDVGISGELAPTTSDHVLVTMQNLGADKLDYWVSRSQRHRCEISSTAARCNGWVDLTNEAPVGLPKYVTQGDREYEGYLELYVPEAAQVTAFSVDGEVPDIAVEQEDGRRSLGVNVRIPPGATSQLGYSYHLPLDGTYSLELRPQPLTSDADVLVELIGPAEWLFEGPDDSHERQITFSDSFDRRLRFGAAPVEHRGLSALWNGVVDFWTNPVF